MRTPRRPCLELKVVVGVWIVWQLIAAVAALG